MIKRQRAVRAAFSSPLALARSRHGVESLESRLLFAAAPSGLRVSNALVDLYDKVTAGQDVTQFARDYNLQLDAQQRVSVTLRASQLDTMSKALGALGFVQTASFPELHFVEGMLPLRAVKAAQAISGRGRYGIEVNYLPVVGAGNVTSQADFVMEADRERLTTPGAFDGTGQRIGVLSNSYNHLGGAAAGVASGDLSPVTVVSDSNLSSDTDEGRAMLELVHDVAPGAALGFATANGGEGTFANNIARLANPADASGFGGATVIVDDVTYFAEPMFQDGVIAQAIDTAVTTRNVNYFSSAGNSASNAYESTTFATGADTVGAVSGSFYDFDPGAGVDTRQQITVPNGTRVTISLQWDDPFYTASGVDTDLDLYLVDSSNVVRASSTASNLSTQSPVEIAQFLNNTGAALTLNVAIRKVTGPNPGRIKYVDFGASIDQFATNSSTLSQHAAAANANGVAAAAYFQQDVPESFTSKGGATILFGPTGTPIAPQTRNSPQITAPDGTNTTFFGSSDFEGDGFKNFFGTSAAAPHAAAVAALVRQANPGFTPAQVYSRLQTTADDITVSGAGFDTLTGFGMINAFDAVYPTVGVASLNFSDGFESGVLPSYYETRSTNSGRIEVTTSDGPFAGSRHVTMDTTVPFAVGGVNQLGLNELTLHVNASGAGTKTLSFWQKEFGDEDHAMPASFTTTSNSDGVALSVDGTNWFRLVSLTGAASTATYTQSTFNLTALATSFGITLGADTRIRFQQYDDFPTSHPSGMDGFAFDDISITNTAAVSATPGTPDLVAATDTGTLSTDNITNRDNSSAAKNLQFSVNGTVSGATVSIYSSGTFIGSAVAAGTTTTVTTNGTVDLADGGRSITARQTESGKSESADSSALTVTIDTAGPTVDVVDVSPDPRTVGVSSVAVNFSEAVAGFDLADLTLTRDAGSNLLSGTNAPTGGSTNFMVPNLLAATSVSGGYVLTVTAAGSGITDVAGNALAANASDTWVHSLPAWLSASGTAASWNSQTKALTVTGAATIIADPAADTPAVSASGASAVLTINPTSDSVINLATLSLASSAVVTMTNHAANPVRALVLNGNPTIAAGTNLDLTNNVLVVRNGNLSGIQAQIAATYAAGAWTGTGGIASSSAATDPTDSTAIGFASNASLNKSSFAGVTGLTSTAVIVKYTYSGDANLDGQVDIGDLGLLSGSWQQPSGKTWFDGDFSFDGAVNIGDLGLLSGNWQKGVGNPL